MTVARGEARHLLLSLYDNGVGEAFGEFDCVSKRKSGPGLPPGERHSIQTW